MKAGEEIKKCNLFLGLILIVITIVLFHDWVQKMGVKLNYFLFKSELFLNFIFFKIIKFLCSFFGRILRERKMVMFG